MQLGNIQSPRLLGTVENVRYSTFDFREIFTLGQNLAKMVVLPHPVLPMIKTLNFVGFAVGAR